MGRASEMKRLPPLKALAAFESVYRLGGYAAAADELCVTESAISHQIGVLERWLGFELFARDKRRVALNRLGELYGAATAKSLGEIRDRTSTVRARAFTRQVRIRSIPSFAALRLIPSLPDFLGSHPDIDLCVINMPNGEPIRADDADFHIVYGAPAAGDWRSIPLLSGHLSAVCHRDYAASARPRTPRDLLKCNLIADAAPDYWLDWFRLAGVEPHSLRYRYVFQDFSMMYCAVMERVGVALCPPDLVREDIETGVFVRLFDCDVAVQNTYQLIYDPHRYPIAGAREAVLDWLLDSCSTEGSLAGRGSAAAGAVRVA